MLFLEEKLYAEKAKKDPQNKIVQNLIGCKFAEEKSFQFYFPHDFLRCYLQNNYYCLLFIHLFYLSEFPSSPISQNVSFLFKPKRHLCTKMMMTVILEGKKIQTCLLTIFFVKTLINEIVRQYFFSQNTYQHTYCNMITTFSFLSSQDFTRQHFYPDFYDEDLYLYILLFEVECSLRFLCLSFDRCYSSALFNCLTLDSVTSLGF